MPDPSLNAAPKATPWWLWFNVLSLDAPLVAVVWQAALAKTYKVFLPIGCHISLGLAVWIIYVVDRMTDSAGRPSADLLTARHLFYQRHRRIILLFFLPVAMALLSWTVLHEIPAGLLARGLGLGFLVVLYLLYYAPRAVHPLVRVVGAVLPLFATFAVVSSAPIPRELRALLGGLMGAVLAMAVIRPSKSSSRLLPKELVCGLIFAVGCSLAVNFYSAGAPLSPETLLLAMLAALNCIGIGCYERAHDALNDPGAITQAWPHLSRYYPAMIVALIAASLWFLSRASNIGLVRYTGTVLLSAVLLGVLHLGSKRLSPELRRVLADAVMLTPLGMMLLK